MKKIFDEKERVFTYKQIRNTNYALSCAFVILMLSGVAFCLKSGNGFNDIRIVGFSFLTIVGGAVEFFGDLKYLIANKNRLKLKAINILIALIGSIFSISLSAICLLAFIVGLF